MKKQTREPIIGISGIGNIALCREIIGYARPIPERPFCVTVNLPVNTIEHRAPHIDNVRYVRRKSIMDMFEVSTPNVIHLVRCVRESATEPLPSAEMLSRAMKMGGKNCHGLRIALDDATTNALEKFRTHHPDALVVLDITSSAFRSRCGGSRVTLLNLLSGYAAEYEKPLIDYVFMEIDERKSTKGFPSRQGLEILDFLLKYSKKNYRLGISGSINEQSLDMLRQNVPNWEKVSVDGGEALCDPETGLLVSARVHEFLGYACKMFKTLNNK